MPLFDEKSRYANLATYAIVDALGKVVAVVPVPEAPNESLLGFHLRKQGERIDHLAAAYLADPAGYWRISDKNDVMLPEALTEAREIAIPPRNK
jgi:hypothetical protein